MIIRRAEEKDFTEICALWESCFHDEKDYVSLFMEHRYNPEFCVILEKDGEVIGMVHLLPCKLYPNQKAFYWYAACIREDQRKKGYFRAFASFVLEESRKAGYANLCVPAPGLHDVYRSLGFMMEYNIEEKEYLLESGVCEADFPIEITEAAPDAFFTLPKKAGDTLWSKEAIKFAFLENAYCNGTQLKISFDGKARVCFAVRKDDGFLIDSHNLSTKEFKTIKVALFETLSCKRIIFRTQGNQKTFALSDHPLVSTSSQITMTLS